MKKLLLLVIILGALGFFYLRDDAPEGPATGTVGPDNAFRPDPASATFTFDDGSITLSRGRNTDEASGEEISLLEERAYGDLNADGKNDTIVFLARSGGGSGVFIYAAAYVSGPVNYKGTNAVFLGDRIAPQNISITNGAATVNYLDRGADEPFAAEPTIPSSLQLVYRNGELTER